jgi:hypothetical protein
VVSVVFDARLVKSAPRFDTDAEFDEDAAGAVGLIVADLVFIALREEGRLGRSL